MEQQSFLFGIPPKKYPTADMVATLKRHRRYRKGIEYDEAAEIIRTIAESHEPIKMPSVAFAMAQYLKEKKQIEEKMKHIKKLPIAFSR